MRSLSQGVYSAADCQKRCQYYERRGCKYFIWHEVSCDLYSDLGGLEYSEPEENRLAGPLNGCFECNRPGWDYVVSTAPSNNLSGKGAVYGVATVLKCAQICKYSDSCEHVTFDQENNLCYLQNSEAQEGAEESETHQTATKGCLRTSCVNQNTRYENGWITRYDTIGRGVTAGIPDVTSASACHAMCLMNTECQFWTYDIDDTECFLVKSNEYLEASSDKISGSRNCV